MRHLLQCLFLSALLSLPLLGYAEEWQRVVHIFDGDTVKLEDGRRVRLIGIDTPEMGRDYQPDEPGAKEARDYLVHWFDTHGYRVRLHLEEEQHDRYHRTLAHLEAVDGADPAHDLLTNGHARVLIFPPNTQRSREQLQWEGVAREQGLGVWRQSDHKLQPDSEVSARKRAFRRVYGVVESVQSTGSGLSLKLQGGLELRMNYAGLKRFEAEGLDPRKWSGQPVAVRGELVPGQHAHLWLDHPLQLESLPGKG